MKDKDQEIKLYLNQLRGVAKRWMGPYNAEHYDDLLQEASIGFLESLDKWHWSEGGEPNPYHNVYVKNRLYNYMWNNWHGFNIVTTKQHKKIFFNRHKLFTPGKQWLTMKDAEQIANQLNVTTEAILDMQEKFSISFYNKEAETEPLIANLLEDERIKKHRELILKGLQYLDERSRNIIQDRYLNNPSLSLREIAERYNISLERVRQIEAASLARLKGVLGVDYEYFR